MNKRTISRQRQLDIYFTRGRKKLTCVTTTVRHRLSMTTQIFALVRRLVKNADSAPTSAENTAAESDMVVSAEEFVRFVGGEYGAAEAAQARLRKVLCVAEAREGITLEAAFGALDKVMLSHWMSCQAMPDQIVLRIVATRSCNATLFLPCSFPKSPLCILFDYGVCTA